jgi:dTDP-4-amino-4,6-dideoxygalactose transaminase
LIKAGLYPFESCVWEGDRTGCGTLKIVQFQLMTKPRIYLSPPHLSGQEQIYVEAAFESNWIAPVGPQVELFEAEMAEWVGSRHAVALTSGTAALHLALRVLGVDNGDVVFCPTLTFAGGAVPALYQGAGLVFIDSESGSWNLDPSILEEELTGAAKSGSLPKAVIAADILGQCADYDPILEACERFEVPVIEDAAQALGATYQDRTAGTLGKLGVFSFNGNKIITTSSGGMLVSDDQRLIETARFLAAHARDPAPHYQHSTVGYNYRMSNILAAIGRGQLRALKDRVAARRRNFDYYSSSLKDLPGVAFMPEAPFGRSTRWLTCLTIRPDLFGATREDIRIALEKENIESRPVWKPLHLQPVMKGFRVAGGAVAEDLFRHGLCLPSGSNLTEQDLERIASVVRDCCAHS